MYHSMSLNNHVVLYTPLHITGLVNTEGILSDSDTHTTALWTMTLLQHYFELNGGD